MRGGIWKGVSWRGGKWLGGWWMLGEGDSRGQIKLLIRTFWTSYESNQCQPQTTVIAGPIKWNRPHKQFGRFSKIQSEVLINNTA